MKNFENVLHFLNKNKNSNFIKYRLRESNLSLEDIKTYEDFKKIKPISRKDLSRISKNLNDFTKMFEKRPIKIFESPGPIYNLYLEEYFQYRYYKALEYSSFSHGDLVVNTFSYHLTPEGEMFDEAVRKIGAVVIPAGPIPSSICAELIKNTNATGFIGTKSFLIKVLEELGEVNPLLKAYLVAEKITQKERTYLSQKYNIEIYQGYGTAEVGLIATECEFKDKMHVDNELFLEVIDTKTNEFVSEGEIGEGKIGEAVITILNSNYPLLRYATGDLVGYTLKRCSCEREDLSITGVFGRVDSSVKLKGVFIHEWSFKEFCDKFNVKGKLVVENSENNIDILKCYISRHVDSFKEDFEEFFKLKLNDIVIDDNLEKTEIVEKRTYLKSV
jgi:phenylacetate-CoA ligase